MGKGTIGSGCLGVLGVRDLMGGEGRGPSVRFLGAIR